jgi:putative ABC transport system permease protein
VSDHTITPALLRNYAKVAVRNLMAYRLYAGINILGLAVGLAAITLASIYIRHEMGYEDAHEKGDRIYRVIRETRSAGDVSFHGGETSGALLPALRSEFPQIEEGASVAIFVYGNTRIEYDGQTFEENVGFADPGFFDMFTFPLISGSAASLRDPSAMFVTQSMAQKVFGSRDPIGEQVILPGAFRGGTYVITGIVKDMPGMSRFRFDFITGPPQTQRFTDALQSWRPQEWIQTYVLLKEGIDPTAIEARLPAFAQRHIEPVAGRHETYHLQPLSRIRLYGATDYGMQYRRGGNINHLYAAVGVALLIMLSACINFVILSTARAADRAREIGIRKVSGAVRSVLIQQFLGEAVIISGLALVGGVFLAPMLLPSFSELVYPTFRTFDGSILGSVQLSLDLSIVPTLMGLTILIGLLAGSYPAFVLSRYQPITAVQGSSLQSGSGRNLRRGLVVTQFALAVVITICTWTVHRQIEFVTESDLGYDTEHVVGLLLFNSSNRSEYESIKQEFLQNSHISMVSAAHNISGARPYAVYPEGATADSIRMSHLSVDEDYLDMFDIELLAGRNFTEGLDHEAYLLNETAVKLLGWTDPIGKTFEAFEIGLRPGYVAGIVQDFHFEDLREPLGPMFITKEPLIYHVLWAKVDAVDMDETLAYMDGIQRRLNPDVPPQRKFLDDLLAERYRDDERLQRVLIVFASVSIVVACMGVFGFVCYMAQQRSKEIAVRKTLGASDSSIVRLLSWDFVGLVVVANVIAWPVAYWLMRQWLDQFANRMELSPAVFLLSGLAVLVMAMTTAAQQGHRAATANPVDSLRSI